MKRNETLLMYGVTGLLGVILLIAVVFGNGNGGSTPGGGTAGLDAARRTDAGGDGDKGPLKDIEDLLGTHSGGARGESKSDPTAQPVGEATPPVEPPPPALPAWLVATTREANYRIVPVNQGDTLSGLLQRYCLDTSDGMVDRVRYLNESIPDLNRLVLGTRLVLPYVADEQLLDAASARAEAERQRTSLAGEPGRNPAGTSPGNPDGLRPKPAPSGSGAAANPGTPGPAVANAAYVVKKGETLWKIAETRVGRRNAPRYIEAILGANPDLDPDRVRENQKIVLPPIPGTP